MRVLKELDGLHSRDGTRGAEISETSGSIMQSTFAAADDISKFSISGMGKETFITWIISFLQ